MEAPQRGSQISVMNGANSSSALGDCGLGHVPSPQGSVSPSLEQVCRRTTTWGAVQSLGMPPTACTVQAEPPWSPRPVGLPAGQQAARTSPGLPAALGSSAGQQAGLMPVSLTPMGGGERGTFPWPQRARQSLEPCTWPSEHLLLGETLGLPSWRAGQLGREGKGSSVSPALPPPSSSR